MATNPVRSGGVPFWLALLLSGFFGLFALRPSVANADGGTTVAADAPSDSKSASPSAPPRQSDQPKANTRYEVGKKVKDFPDREDLSTPERAYAAIHRAWAAEGNAAWARLSVPELAARMPEAEKQPLPKELAERALGAEILEVHIWDGDHACVIAREKDGRRGDFFDLRYLNRIDGRWLNKGNDACDSLEHARQKIAQVRGYQKAAQRREQRPAIADPAAHLQKFVDFLKREAKDPQAFVLDAIEKHRLVILSELHHRPRYWAFAAGLVRSPEFARRVGVIYLELPSNDQALVDRFLAAAKYDPQPVIEMLRDNLWTGWPDQAMLDFFRTAWEVNQKLPERQRLRIEIVDMRRPWKEIHEREDWRKYDVDRDRFMADNILRDLKDRADGRHALFIVGYGHAMQDLRWGSGEPMKSAGWHLRRALGAKNVYAIFPHGPVITNMGRLDGRLAQGLFETAFAAMGNKPMAFPLDHGPFGEQLFDADPERLTPDPYNKGYHAFLYLGPLENEVFSPLIPGFYTDEFIKELDRRNRIMAGHGLVEAGVVEQLDGASFAAWMGNSWGKPRGWSTDQLGPLDAWKHGSTYKDATLKRLSSVQAKTGKVLEVPAAGARFGTKSMVNLTSGDLVAPDPKRFRGDNPEGIAWMKENGIDLIAFGRTDFGDQGLAGYGMVVAKIDNNGFDRLDLAGAKRALRRVEKEAAGVPAMMMSIKSGVPATYAIRTRSGRYGVLQIEDARLSATPIVFRVRYKLFPSP